jgi:hypothetical protein
MKFNPLSNHRILVIDDNQGIHELIRHILLKSSDFPDHPDENENAGIFRSANRSEKAVRQHRGFAVGGCHD